MNGRKILLWTTAVLAWSGVAISLLLQVAGALGIDAVGVLLVLFPLLLGTVATSAGVDILPRSAVHLSPNFPWRHLRNELGERLTWLCLASLIYAILALVTLTILEEDVVGQVHGNQFFHNGNVTIATPGEIRAEHARVEWGFAAFAMSNFLVAALIATKRIRNPRNRYVIRELPPDIP